MSDKELCRALFPSGNCGVKNCKDGKHGHYQLILVDPPWDYTSTQKGKKGFAGYLPYSPMRYRDLKGLPIHDIAEKDCALLLWSTGPFLPQAIKVMETWGFRYVTTFGVWRKIYASGRPVCAPGCYSRSCHEYLLLGSRGRISSFRRACNLNQLIDDDYKQLSDAEHTIVAQRSGHSVKPQEAFELMEEFFTCDRKIELFARAKQAGWDAWGLELPDFFQKDAPARKRQRRTWKQEEEEEEEDEQLSSEEDSPRKKIKREPKENAAS